MNPLRFLRKCVTDPEAASKSARLVLRSMYGRLFWAMRSGAPLPYRLPSGGVLLLEQGHSFTHCFWPAVDRYEPDVQAALQTFLKPGGVFIDCGANVGYFSVMAGALVGPTGRVVAVEANPNTFALLQRNLEVNGRGTALHCALTDQQGVVELYTPRSGGDVYSSTRKGGLVVGDDIDVFRVGGRTLDDVLESEGICELDVVKIDVEGAELAVLNSAPRMMQELRPLIICEYGTNTWPAFGATAEQLLTLLAERDYVAGVFDLQSHRVRPAENSTWESPYSNLILQPRELV